MNLRFDPQQIPLPRLWAFMVWDDNEDPESLSFGFEISDRHSDPILDVAFEIPWRRPRPWAIEGWWPDKHPTWQRDHPRFQWRRP